MAYYTVTAMTDNNSLVAGIAGGWSDGTVYGRGWYGGSFVDHIDGQMDSIRFSDVALSSEELIPNLIPEPATLAMLGLGRLLLRRRK